MIRPKWIVAHECDLDGTYNVTLDDCITVAKTCSSLTSAKLWVTAHLL